MPLFSFLEAQNVPEHIDNQTIVLFLDEMASSHIIELNSSIKPYSRSFIAEKLLEIKEEEEKLNKRQKAELEKFLKEYSLELKTSTKEYRHNLLKKTQNTALTYYPLGLYYNDYRFRFSLKSIYGVKHYSTSDSSAYQRWGGMALNAYVNDNFGFYVSLTDHHYSSNIVAPQYLIPDQGAILKGEDYLDFAEIRGGINYSWKWGHIGLKKDRIAWGEAYNGTNILSGKTPSIAMLEFGIKPSKWFEFNYIHARLASDLLDSSRSYIDINGMYRRIMHEKYLVANMFTFKPFKNFHISAGNSLIYSDEGMQLQYLIPFMFFKAVDDTYNGTNNNAGHNSQMFATISSRNVKFTHLYASLFIDEMSIRRFRDPDRHSNFISGKAGVHISNPFKTNLFFTAEYTRTNPLTYQHFIATTSFETNQFCMGHYLKDNVDELYFSLNFKPFESVNIGASYQKIRKGTPFIYGVVDPWGVPFMDDVVWSSNRLAFSISYELFSKIFLNFEATSYKNQGDATTYVPFYLSRDSGTAFVGQLSIGF